LILLESIFRICPLKELKNHVYLIIGGMMAQKKKLKMKDGTKTILKSIGVLFAVILVLFIIYRNNINEIRKVGYSEKASAVILRSFQKKFVLSRPFSETLNRAFESNHFKEENMDSYSKIEFQDQKSLIRNINTLINKKYSNQEISMILTRGNDEDVTEFAKRDKIQYLEEIYSIPFAKLRNYDRYMEYMNETGVDENTAVIHINLGMDKDIYEDPITVDSHDIDILVNKRRRLSEKFAPKNLVSISEKYAKDGNQKGVKVAVESLTKMIDAARKEGQEIFVTSGYRSYQDQLETVNTYRDLYGDSYINNFVSLPGHSEHQTGLAFDLGSKTSSIFRSSKEFTWMTENAHKFGFIYRFQLNKEELTGFRSEPWHFRYVGKEAAEKIYNNRLSLEEYYVMYLSD